MGNGQRIRSDPGQKLFHYLLPAHLTHPRAGVAPGPVFFGDINRAAARQVHYLRTVHYLPHSLLFFFFFSSLHLAALSELEVKVWIRRDVRVVFITRPQTPEQRLLIRGSGLILRGLPGRGQRPASSSPSPFTFVSSRRYPIPPALHPFFLFSPFLLSFFLCQFLSL